MVRGTREALAVVWLMVFVMVAAACQPAGFLTWREASGNDDSATVAPVAPPQPIPSTATPPAPAASWLPPWRPTPGSAPPQDSAPAIQEPVAGAPISLDRGPLTACQAGRIVFGSNAVVTPPVPPMSPGVLFAASGSFAEKPVDTPCDPGQSFGPYQVSAGGKLRVHLTGSPPVPPVWSLFNNGVGMVIVFEPLLGEGNYGPAQEIARLVIPAEQAEVTMEAEWSGPGRISAYTGAPRGGGPLTGQCFGQSYNATVEIIEAHATLPGQHGIALPDAAVIATQSPLLFTAGTANVWLGSGSEVTVETQVAGQSAVLAYPQWKLDLMKRADALAKTGLPMPRGYYADPHLFWGSYRDTTLIKAHDIIRDLPDCEAAVALTLFLDANSGEWKSSNFQAKTYDLAVDVASIWLLPGKWDSLGALAKQFLKPIPGIGYVQNMQNVSDTYQRIMKEILLTDADKKARLMFDVFDRTRGWDDARITQRDREIDDEIIVHRQTIEREREQLERHIQRLDDQLQRDGCDKDIIYHPQSGCALRVGRYWDDRNSAERNYHLSLTRIMAQITDLETERTTLLKYRLPLATGNCDQLKQPPPQVPQPGIFQQLCDANGVKLVLGKGILYVGEQKSPWVKPAIYVVNEYILRPANTEQRARVLDAAPSFSIEKRDETAIISVFSGALEATAPDGRQRTIRAGQRLTLPDGVIDTIDQAAARGVLIEGLPIDVIPLNSGTIEPYGVSILEPVNGKLPPGWIWQDTSYGDPGATDATIEQIAPDTLRITVPSGNILYHNTATAPRLLHKVTGDFDLEADMTLESVGMHWASSEFLIFSPDVPIGYLSGSTDYGSLAAQYLVKRSGWWHAENLRGIPLFDRKWGSVRAEPKSDRVRFKLSRRGSLFRTYWSDDGGVTWTLSDRRLLQLPTTIWAGLIFQRDALDRLVDEPAITTLSNVRLTSAPLESMPEDEWDIVAPGGFAAAFGSEIIIQHDGVTAEPIKVYSQQAIEGDFDLVVRIETPQRQLQPGQERYIFFAVSSLDNKQIAYVRKSQTADWQRDDSDMAIGGGWGRYKYRNSADISGRMRLVRKNGVFTSYVWQDGEWQVLADWQNGFTDPVYLNSWVEWKTPTPEPIVVRYVIEQLETSVGAAPETDTSASPETSVGAAPETGVGTGPVAYQVSASDTAPPGQDVCGNPTSYAASNVTDGDPTTAWRVLGDGKGASLRLTFAAPVTVTELRLITGYAKRDPCANGVDRWPQGYRASVIEVTFSDGTSARYELADIRELQSIPFARPVVADRIDIVIRETRPPQASGAPRPYTAISEIVVIGTRP
ncbi:NADase-type glycan-binding domain-containing protein [Roseiflexus sp.]|uniref:discoidin domain-containing protein n=1 Tax=Roseiflexus sp. TaxID=2562120 RepID=UPI00398B2DD1